MRKVENASMKYVSTMLVVKDLERSLAFYKKYLEQEVTVDFGANVTLSGGFALQTFEAWQSFVGGIDIRFKGNDTELYFETDDYDDFIAKTEDWEYAHPPIEHRWGQRVVRFYDPDGHVIEVGENLATVAKRFADSGMSIAEVASRMGVREEYVIAWME